MKKFLGTYQTILGKKMFTFEKKNFNEKLFEIFFFLIFFWRGALSPLQKNVPIRYPVTKIHYSCIIVHWYSNLFLIHILPRVLESGATLEKHVKRLLFYIGPPHIICEKDLTTYLNICCEVRYAQEWKITIYVKWR